MAAKSPGQPGMPKGLIGRILGRIMAWHNAADYRYTIECLGIDSDARVLEVGFGSGAAIAFLANAYPKLHIAGVDHSGDMLAMASSRNRAAIRAGSVELQAGSVMALPYPDTCFDKAFSINCIYFWEDPVQGLKELRRVLQPGGMVAIAVRDRRRKAYQPFRPERLTELLGQAGFSEVRVLSNSDASHPLNCALGRK